jgi:hypothetical protein
MPPGFLQFHVPFPCFPSLSTQSPSLSLHDIKKGPFFIVFQRLRTYAFLSLTTVAYVHDISKDR